MTDGPVTVVFSDVEGSTSLQATRGDSDARALIGACEEVLRRHVEAGGGWVVKTLGDGLMAAFSSPRRALLAMLEANRELGERGGDRLRIRTGVHTGEVLLVDDDIHGGTVSLAARICAKADGGEILVSEVVRQLCGSVAQVSFQDRGKTTLKGFPERWTLYRVVPSVEPRRADNGVTPFVGRIGLRTELRGLMERAAGGAGAIVLLAGEPGVGKSRTAAELAGEAVQRGFSAFTGHCSESGDLPYMPWVEIVAADANGMSTRALRSAFGAHAPALAQMVPDLRRALPDLPAPPDMPADQQRWYLFHAVRQYLCARARDRPQLLVLEDLHWSDDSTLLLLEDAAKWVSEVPVLIVGTHRDAPSEVTPRFSTTLGKLARTPAAEMVTLSRLSADEVMAMLSALAGQPAPAAAAVAIHTETDGNAFFVQELFRHLSESGRLLDDDGRIRTEIQLDRGGAPARARLVIDDRIARLGDETVRVLSAAALIGRRFEYRTLAHALTDTGYDLVGAVEEALDAQLLVDATDSEEVVYWFSHELVRQTFAMRLSAPRRQQLHLAIADALEHLSGEDHDAHIARHLVGAGSRADPQRTAAFLTRAGNRSQSAAAFEDALRSYERALALIGSGRRSERAQLLLKIGLAHRSLRAWDDAIAVWEKAITLLADLGEVESAAEQCWELSQQLSWAYRFPEMAAVLRRGLEVLGSRESPQRPRLLGMTGLVTAVGGRHDLAALHISDARVCAETVADPLVRAQVSLIETIDHYFHMRLPEATDAGLRASAELRTIESPWNLADALAFLNVGVTFRGDFALSEQIHEEVEPLAVRLGHWAAASSAHRSDFARAAALRGALDELGELALAQRELADDVGNDGWVAYAETVAGIVDMWRGEWDRAAAHLREGVTLGAPFWFGAHHGFQLLLKAHRGQLADVRERLGSLSDALPVPGKPNRLGSWTLAVVAAEAAGVLGDATMGNQLYPLVREALETGAVMRQVDGRLIQTSAGMAAAAAGEHDLAAEHFEMALRQCAELPHALETPHAQHAFGRFLLDHGAPADADRGTMLLHRAVDGFARIGMPRHERLAADVLASCYGPAKID